MSFPVHTVCLIAFLLLVAIVGDAYADLCKDGSQQSPVALECRLPLKNLHPLRIDVTPFVLTADSFLSTKEFLQLNYPGELKSRLLVEGQNLFMQGVTFHFPSEHTIEGQHMTGEIQLLFTTADRSQRAGISVFVREAGSRVNAGLEPVIKSLRQLGASSNPSSDTLQPTQSGFKYEQFDPTKLLPKDPNFFFYEGSATLPPCDENYMWFVMRQSVPVSSQQRTVLAKFITHPNNRPTQKLGTRQVRSSAFPFDEGSAIASEVYSPKIAAHASFISTAEANAVRNPIVTDGRHIWGFVSDVPPGLDDGTPGSWSYDSNSRTGPQYWNRIDGSYDKCAGGSQMQSPIDLRYASLLSDLEPLTPTTQPFLFQFGRVSDSLVIPYPEDVHSLMTIGGVEFALQQLEVKRPAEHVSCTLGKGVLELQFMFRSRPNPVVDHVVTGILALWYKVGKQTDPLITAIADGITHGRANIPPVQSLLPRNNTVSYFNYEGSLTRPPCTEGVQWYVVRSPRSVTQAQLDVINKAIIHADAKPLANAGSNRLIRLFAP